MKKSRYIFCVLGAVYVFVGVGILFDMFQSSNNLLFGLSLSALLISASDMINGFAMYRDARNNYEYILKLTLDFLQTKINIVPYANQIVNVRGLYDNLCSMYNPEQCAVHPFLYSKDKTNKLLHLVANILFIISIAIFVCVPMLQTTIQNSIWTKSVTLFAFAAMCLNVFVDEMASDIQEKIMRIVNDKHLIIQAAFSDFHNYYWCKYYARVDDPVIPSDSNSSPIVN